MQYKIKVKPEDFYVKEIVSLPIKDKGQYGVFILKKRGWNTVDILRRIGKTLGIPLTNISYGGKKDRHAFTEQFITIKNIKKKILVKDVNYSLQLLGFSEEPMDPRHIIGNEFKITIRSISKEAEEFLYIQLQSIEKYGFINYFDDQRFGSFDPKQGFIGEKIIKGHYNGALKIYLTHIYPEDKKEARERKNFLFENWGNWQKCLSVAKTQMEKLSFNHLIENPKDYLTILKKIPKEEMSMFFSAYQSYLWNETARSLLLTLLSEEEIIVHKGIVGDYIFFNEIDKEKSNYLMKLQIPTASSKLKMPDEITEKIYNNLLQERKVKHSMFNLKKIRQAFFKSIERDVIVKPELFKYTIEDDEVYENRRKMTISFFLPRGSYATMLIKRIFAKKPLRRQ